MSSFDKELEEELKKLKKKKNQTYSDALSSQNDLLSNGIYSYLPSSDDDIAPVKRNIGGGSFGKEADEDEGLLDFFDSGSFRDGYQFGDVTKAILGTAGDAATGIAKGVMRMGEGLVDLAGYAAAGTARLFGNDEIADAWQYAAEESATDEIFGGSDKFLDKYSLLGRTSNAVTEGIGQVATIIATGGAAGAAGLGSAGVTAMTTGVMGLSGMGSGMSEAYEGGATDGEAVAYGAISGAADALTELIFGGMGKAINAVGFSKGLSSADDLLAQKVSGLFKKQITKNLAEFGIKAGAEGFEEVLAGLAQGAGKWITYQSEKDLGEIMKDENLLEQFVVGAVTSGLSQSGIVPGMKGGSLKESIENKTDFITGLTQNEQAVIDKEFQNRVAEEEKKGKVTGKDKNKIYDEVMRDMEKGYISIETIEEVLGDKGEYDALLKESEEFNTLYNKEGGLSKAQQDRLAELEAKNKANPYETALKTAKGKFSQGVFDLVKDSRLSESYREEARKGEDFQYDLTKFKGAKHQDAVQKTLENAVKAGANNTNRVHDLVDMNAKLSGETGIVFEYKTGEQIKNDFIERQTKKIQEIEIIPADQRTEEQSAFVKKMKDTLAKVESGEIVVDGDITPGRIVMNLDSPKPLQRTVGHEITHSLEPEKGEASKEYTALRDALFSYAKDKGVDIDQRIAELKMKYQGITDANPEAELVADLVGDYLFTDNDFINNLSTKHRNVFQKIYDEIKHLLKLARAGSKEARDLERVKKAFEDAFRESGKAKGDTKYSLAMVEKVQPKSDKWSRTHTTEEAMARFPNMWNVASEESEVRNPTQITSTVNSYRKIYDFLQGEGFDGTILDASSGLGYGTRAGIEEYGFKVEDIEPYPDKSYNPKYKDYSSLDKKYDVIISNAVLNVLPQDQRDALAIKMGELLNDGGRLFVNVRGKDVESLAKTGKNIHLGNMEWIETVKGSYQKGFTKPELVAYLQDALGDGFTVVPTNMFGAVSAIVTKTGEAKYSLSDSSGKQLTKEQGEFFKDSKMRDADGHLKVMYHGTTRGGFHTFDPDYSDDGISLFFVDNNGTAASYSGTRETYEAKTFRTADDFNRFFAEIGATEYSAVEEGGTFKLLEDGDEIATSETAAGLYEEFRDWSGLGEGDVNYKVYLNLKNPLEVDADGREWNALPAVNKESEQYAYIKIVEVGDGLNEVTIEYAMAGDPSPVTETVDLYQKFTDSLADTLSNMAPGEKLEGAYANPSTTREYAQYAKENGYDGVIFKNIYDIGGYGGASHRATVAIAFDSNQVKSVANTNPTADPDIRYSLSSIANTFFGDENMSASEFKRVDYRQTQGYQDYVDQCVNNLRQVRGTDFDAVVARKEVEDSIAGIVKVAIAAKQAGYDIYDDATKRSTKDSKNRLLFSSLEPNSDYFTSNDISTICDKRKNFADIYDDIVKAEEAKGVPKGKRFFDNVDNYFAIHKIMADKGLTTPCRQCYVESMRKNLAPMANAFLRLVQEADPDNTANDQLYHQKGKQKGELKTSNASTREFVLSALAEHPEYGMTVADLSVQKLTTADGLAQIKIQAPLIYEAFNSFYGQSKPKMPKAATPFRFGELTALLTDEKGRIKQSLVDKINSTGGFRLQSYSDFQIQNYTDVLQVLFEAGTLGLNGHAYTKVPAFLDATEGTNLKRNISIFMYKDGDEWKLDKNDSFPYDLEEIYNLVKEDKTGSTSIIAVSQNADMSAWIMANDYVGYGIPFHKSGLKMGTVRDTIVREDGREIKGYTGTKDHTKQQTEVWAKATEDHKALTKVKKGINIYSFWDFDNKANLSKNELIKKNVKAYIDACERAGYLPKFREYVMNNGKVLNDVLEYSKKLGFASQDATIADISFEYKGYTIPYGYYKFLGDFGMFTPDGKAAPQKPLSLEGYDFDKAVQFFSDAEGLRRNEILQQFANGAERRKYRDSDLTAGELEEIVRQKRSEVVKSVVPGDDIAPTKQSLSAKGEEFTPIRNGLYGKDFRVQKPMQETSEEVAPVAENAAVEEDLFPDELSPLYEELDKLNQQKEALESRMLAAINSEDMDTFYQVNSEYEAVMARIAELDAEAAAEDADRLGSLEDADAPPETESYDDHVADDIPLTKTLVNGLAKEIKAKLGIPNSRTAEVRDLIQRYSKEEFPSKAHLYTEIAERFGTFTEKQIDEELKGVKSILRTHGIRVDDSIKQDIADYGQFQRSNFGKVRFSKDGLPVDVAYREFQELLPGYFPDSISVPSDQLLRIVEVANLDTTSVFEQEIDSQTLEEATDAIMKAVGDFRQKHRETFAEQQGREAFKSVMESADQNVPPVRLPNMPVTRAEMKAQPGDIAPVFDTSSGQQAFLPEEEVPKKVTRGELHESIVDKVKTTFREKGFDFDEVLKKAKDLSTFATVDNTPQRVMEKALGYKQGQVLSDLTVNQVAQNETEGIKWLNSFTDKKSGLLAKISKQYGIKPGSKESAAAQMYAEGFYVGENDAIIAYGDSELAKDFPNAKVQENIKKLARDPRIRQIYDETLEAINASRTRNAYPEIPRLENYFLHFRAMEDTFSRLGLPFNPNDIRAKDLPTDLNGVTADLKPGQPYFASAMHRKGKRTSFDLLGGLEKYLSSAKNQIYHIDDIQTLRALRNYVAETYGQAHGLENLDTMSDEEAEQRIKEVYNSHLSTFAKFLNEEANILAGKTSLIDRGLEGIIGRRGITTLDTINRQVGANMVGFNVSSSLTNLLAPIQAFAKTNKFDFVKAMAQTASNKIGSLIGKGDTFAEDSPVMIRRKGAERFYRTPWEKAGDVGYLMMGVVDDISTELIARTKYNELTRKGMDSQQAHFETDKWVSRLMGDRSLGQQPQLYNSKMLGLFTKFQLEVRNQLDSQFYDTIQEAKASTEDIENGLLRNAKKAAKITSTFVQLAVVQHLFGKAFESIAGYNPAFDIIEALIKTFGWDDEEDDEDTVLDNIEQGFLELLGDLPYTSTLTGGRIPIESALPVTELIKGEDKYGNEKSRWETLGEIAPYYLLPGGYGQIKKTVQGLNMFDEEHPIAGSYTDKGDLRFPVEDTLANRVQAGLFGQWASGNAQDYFDGERKPLNEKQTQEFIDVGLTIQDYWKYRDGMKDLKKQAEKIAYINGLNVTAAQKKVLKSYLFDEAAYAEENPEKYAFLEKEGIGYIGYRELDEETQNSWSWAFNNQDKYNHLKANGVYPEDYEVYRIPMVEFDDESNDAYLWEFDNPEKSTLAKAVTGDVVSYRKYAKDLDDIRADKDANGKTINGSAKEKKVAYINSLDLDYGQKIILYKSLYESDDTYNVEIVRYLDSREDISYEEMVTILTELGFQVSSNGTVTWD